MGGGGLGFEFGLRGEVGSKVLVMSRLNLSYPLTSLCNILIISRQWQVIGNQYSLFPILYSISDD